MKEYYRIVLGQKNSYAKECFDDNFIGADYGILQDLSADLSDDWKEFNQKYIPIWLMDNPDKSRVSAGLSCGQLWTIAKGINKGDIVICNDGNGEYHIGEILDNYRYDSDAMFLPHRRTVKWLEQTIFRNNMSDALRNSTGSIGTVCNITKYASEIETFITNKAMPVLISTDETIEDPTVFALEKHLEDFLVANWSYTELGKLYDIFNEGGELIGQQYPTDTGTIDILAISKDKSHLLVVELKKGRASDSVIGQIMRYMGYIKQEIAEGSQSVSGVIIALEDDKRIRRALASTNNIDFYRYKINFTLDKVNL
ncbi:MAG: endonuclease NucS [Burkholderiales bacterium]|nr:endonuclease NucS [Burkholderiales bacterium]